MGLKLFAATLATTILLPTYGWAAEQWLIASKSETINFGQKIKFDIVKLEDSIDWPATFKIKLSGNGSSEEIELIPAKSPAASALHRSYVGVACKDYVGIVRAELADQSSNRLSDACAQRGCRRYASD